MIIFFISVRLRNGEKIFDTTGKNVLTFDESEIYKSKYEYIIDVYSLANGIYFAHFKGDNFEGVDKFIKE